MAMAMVLIAIIHSGCGQGFAIYRLSLDDPIILPFSS
jgi:hypothetical protein